MSSDSLNQSFYQWGSFSPFDQDIGLGILAEQVIALSASVPLLDDSWGVSATYTTGSTIGNKGGFRVQKLLTNRSRNPVMNCVFKLNQTADTILYIGLWDSASTAPAGTDPLNAKNGFALVIDGANFKIAHNDAGGATVFDNLQPEVAVDTSTYILRIDVADNNAFRLSLTKYSTVNAASTLTVTSEIPDPTQFLTGVLVTETAAAAAKSINVHRWEMFC